MKRLLLFIPVLFLVERLSAQSIDSLNYGPEPAGGISTLALHYFKIGFTKEQRKLLNQEPLEFIYSVDLNGKPKLEKVNGVTDPVILDSLFRVSQNIPNFQPQVVDGKAVNSMFFMALQFPSYGKENLVGLNRFSMPLIDDYESIETGGSIDILFGGAFNMFSGSANNYLKPGGGFIINMFFTGKKGTGVGMDMSVFGNSLKQNYPIASTRKQNSAPPTMFLGLLFNKPIHKTEKHLTSLQFEANYVIQNITQRIDNYDKDYTQFAGFSPGIILNYSLKIGKDKLSMYYYSPSVINHWINFHVGLRQLFLDFKKANGTMIEMGVSYRMRNNIITNYKLKE